MSISEITSFSNDVYRRYVFTATFVCFLAMIPLDSAFASALSDIPVGRPIQTDSNCYSGNSSGAALRKNNGNSRVTVCPEKIKKIMSQASMSREKTSIIENMKKSGLSPGAVAVSDGQIRGLLPAIENATGKAYSVR